MAKRIYHLRATPYTNQIRLSWECEEPDDDLLEIRYRLWDVDCKKIKEGLVQNQTAIDKDLSFDLSTTLINEYASSAEYIDFQLIQGATVSAWSNQLPSQHQGPTALPTISISPAAHMLEVPNERQGLGRIGNYPWKTYLYLVDGKKDTAVTISDTGSRLNVQFYYRTVNYQGVYSEWKLITNVATTIGTSTITCAFTIGPSSKEKCDIGTTFEFATGYNNLQTKNPCTTQVQIGGGSNIWVNKNRRALGQPHVLLLNGWKPCTGHIYNKPDNSSLTWNVSGGLVSDNFFYGQESVVKMPTDFPARQVVSLPSLGLIPGNTYEISDTAISCALLAENTKTIKDSSVILVHSPSMLGKREFTYQEDHPYLVLYSTEIDLVLKDILSFNPRIYNTEPIKN